MVATCFVSPILFFSLYRSKDMLTVTGRYCFDFLWLASFVGLHSDQRAQWGFDWTFALLNDCLQRTFAEWKQTTNWSVAANVCQREANDKLERCYSELRCGTHRVFCIMQKCLISPQWWAISGVLEDIADTWIIQRGDSLLLQTENETFTSLNGSWSVGCPGWCHPALVKFGWHGCIYITII